MKNVLFTVIFTMTALILCAQEKGTLHGRVFHLESKRPLSGATIEIRNLLDTTILARTLSDSEGRFILRELPLRDSLSVEIRYTGLDEFYGIAILKDKVFYMEAVGLRPSPKLLNEVAIKAYRKPYVIREDTIEFDAKLVRTPPNSKAGDLLKRIPGLAVDMDGRLSFNGKPVTRLFVDGRVFFSENGGVALSHVPADLIDKVQLNDAMTEIEKKIDPSKAGQAYGLNLKLKAGKKFFGDFYGAGGTDQRYDLSGMSSSMGKRNISITGGMNNINKQVGGLNKQALLSTQGGGIIKTLSTGLDYDEQFGKGKDMHASYNFSRPVTEKEVFIERRQNILQDSSLFSSSSSNSFDKNVNHSFNMVAQLGAGFSVGGKIENTRLDQETESRYQTTGQNGGLLNNAETRYIYKGTQNRYDGGVSYLRRFQNDVVTLRLTGGYDWGKQDHFNQTSAIYYGNGTPQKDIFDQQLREKSRDTKFDFFGSYAMKLNTISKLFFSNSFNGQINVLVRESLILDTITQMREKDFNYSNNLQTSVYRNNSSLRFEYRKSKMSFDIGLPIIQTYLNYTDRLNVLQLNRKFVNFTPRVSFSYKFSNEKSIEFKSAVDARNPLPEQLQSVKDNRNPLFEKQGNPNLEPSKSLNTIFLFNSRWDSSKKPYVNIGLIHNYDWDKIIPFITYDGSGRQVSKLGNVSGSYVYTSFLRHGLTFRSDKASVLMIGSVEGKYQLDKVFLNGALSSSKTFSFSPDLTLGYIRQELATFYLTYKPSLNSLRYTSNPIANSRYTLQSISFNSEVYLFSRLKYSNLIFYQYNSQTPAEFDNKSLLWNASLSYLFLKDKRAEFRLNGFDLLKENNNMLRTVGSTYIEDSISNNLQRYVTIGFAYNFKGIKE